MNRKIDELGRLVIPKEMRKQLGINAGDLIKMELKDNQIILSNTAIPTLQERIDKAIKLLEDWNYLEKIDCYYEPLEVLNILKGE